MKVPENVIISRTDSVGDVILTMPVAAVLKRHFPNIKIGFLGNVYTKDVITACKYVDEFIDVNDFYKKEINICNQKPQVILHVLPEARIAKRAKQLNIPIRVGTINRPYHWFTCNKLIQLNRKNAPLHEAQLNLKILQPFGINIQLSLEEIPALYGLEKLKPLPEKFIHLINKNKYNLILHPMSRGSAREWGTDNFIALIKSLDKNLYNIFISGVENEREFIKPFLDEVKNEVTDIIGLMNLNEFMSFISQCDGVVACSTGPVHIAAALGKDALGIYAPLWSIRPERWGPVGNKAQIFVVDKICSDCKGNKQPCHCIKEVQPERIKNALDKIPKIDN